MTTITNDALRIMGKMSAGVADTLLQDSLGTLQAGVSPVPTALLQFHVAKHQEAVADGDWGAARGSVSAALAACEHLLWQHGRRKEVRYALMEVHRSLVRADVSYGMAT